MKRNIFIILYLKAFSKMYQVETEYIETIGACTCPKCFFQTNSEKDVVEEPVPLQV